MDFTLNSWLSQTSEVSRKQYSLYAYVEVSDIMISILYLSSTVFRLI